MQQFKSIKTNGNHTKSVLDVVIALYPFQSQNEEELSFQKNDRLEIIERPENDPDWWKARNQLGEIGLIPKNYVLQDSDRSEAVLSTHNAISSQLWYYGSISRGDCDKLLNDCGDDGDFLIRDSETSVCSVLMVASSLPNHMVLLYRLATTQSP